MGSINLRTDIYDSIAPLTLALYCAIADFVRQCIVSQSPKILHFLLDFAHTTSPTHKTMASDVPFVPGEATYTLGLSISQDVAKVFDDGEKRTHMRLSILFPHKDFAERLERNLRGVSNGAVFNRESVRLSNDDTRKVHILLPSCVRRIETNDKGITLVFKKKEDADTWKKRLQIWSRKSQQSTEFDVSYNWTHKKLAETVSA